VKVFLDRVYATYHRKEWLSSDPLEFVHRYADPLDQEVVGLLSALFAYGNVIQIRRTVETILERITSTGQSPSHLVRLWNLKGGHSQADLFKGIIHRFHTGRDIAGLLALIAESHKQYGSVAQHFAQYASEGMSSALSLFIRDWKAWIPKLGLSRRVGPQFTHLLSAPDDGSVCKRWCMFLRWMVREDELDPGTWKKLWGSAPALTPDQLVLPLDTHTGRISQYLGLTSRKSLNWKAALEITEALKFCDPKDPVKYDFALARLGILDLCQKRFRVEICEKCELLPVCRFARAKGATRSA